MNNWIYEVIFNLIKNQMFIAIVSAVLVYEFNKYKEFKNKNEERLSVLNALQAELSSLNLLICNREETTWLLFKWLNRRSQKKSYTIAGFFGSVLKAFPLPLPKVYVSLFYKGVQI